jgi:hypothetical protein
METVSRTTSIEYQSLVGRIVEAVYQDAGYWHLFVALRCIDGQTMIFNTEDVGIAKYFEVFPIKIGLEPTEQRAWEPLHKPRRVVAVSPLYREEWLEPTDPHPEHVGSGPHYAHNAGQGPAPAQALYHVTVQAGFKLHCEGASPIVVFASNTAPFNVEVALHSSEIESALSAFNPTEA